MSYPITRRDYHMARSLVAAARNGHWSKTERIVNEYAHKPQSFAPLLAALDHVLAEDHER
ncbi:hypothetical protein [Nocardia sp. NPDC020380]|uniref:hypothetical protein n=1 Tax=Nocardia sp. NPDC020380 TaxID=3364309 RepID=UPI0037A14418